MKFLSHLLSIGIVLILIALAACAIPDKQSAPARLTIAGSTSMLPLLQELARAYEHEAALVTVEVQGGGSQLGVTTTRSRQVDIGMSSRPLRDDEEKDAATGERKLWATLIAYDGIAVIVNSQNTVENLSRADLRAIFSGEVWNWAFVGGAGGETVVVSRAGGSGTRAVFEEQVMSGTTVTPRAVVMPHSVAVVDFVAQEPNAVGYVSMGYLTETGETSEAIKAVSVEGIPLTVATISSQEYPLARPLFLLTSSKSSGEIKSFINFALSDEGQTIIGKRYGRVK